MFLFFSDFGFKTHNKKSVKDASRGGNRIIFDPGP